MFKFVAVVAFLAVAAATPDPAFISAAPLAYSTGFGPAVSAYNLASPYNHASPLLYSSPGYAYPGQYGYAHLIKKRSAPLFTSYYASANLPYTAPLAYAGSPLTTTYAASPLTTTYAAAPLATTYTSAYGAPLVHSAPVYTAAHLIKKRAAPVIVPSASYYSPAAYSSAPLVSAYSTYSAGAPFYSTPYYAASPYAYTQYIKK